MLTMLLFLMGLVIAVAVASHVSRRSGWAGPHDHRAGGYHGGGAHYGDGWSGGDSGGSCDGGGGGSC